MNMTNCILLILLLLISMVILKCITFPLVIHFLNFVRLFHVQVLLVMIFPCFLCDLLSPVVPDDSSCKDTFSFVSQIKNSNFSCKFLVSYDVTSLFTNIPLQETTAIAISLILNHNCNLTITKKELKKLFLFATFQTLFLTVNLINKMREQPWVLPQLLSLLIISWVFTNLNG